MTPPRSAFGAPPQGGDAGGPAEPDPRRPLGGGAAERCWRAGALATVGLALLVGAVAVRAQAASAPAPAASAAPDNAALAAEGRRRYTGLCARCHGLNLVTVGIGFDLRTFPADDKARFVRSVTQGLRAMPSFANVVQPADLEAIWAYIGSVNGWGP